MLGRLGCGLRAGPSGSGYCFSDLRLVHAIDPCGPWFLTKNMQRALIRSKKCAIIAASLRFGVKFSAQTWVANGLRLHDGPKTGLRRLLPVCFWRLRIQVGKYTNDPNRISSRGCRQHGRQIRAVHQGAWRFQAPLGKCWRHHQGQRQRGRSAWSRQEGRNLQRRRGAHRQGHSPWRWFAHQV